MPFCLLFHKLPEALTGKLCKGVGGDLLHAQALLLGDSGREAESLDATADADTAKIDPCDQLSIFKGIKSVSSLPDGVDGDVRVDVALQLGGVHVRHVLEIVREAVVVADEGVEHILQARLEC